jgi:hypothetical protein
LIYVKLTRKKEANTLQGEKRLNVAEQVSAAGILRRPAAAEGDKQLNSAEYLL